MNPIENPYTPGAGTRPQFLAGREKIIEDAKILFGRVKFGHAQRSLMLYGLRGVGKTVLLNEFEDIAKKDGYLVEFIEMTERNNFKKVIARCLRKILLQVSTLENAKEKLKKALGVLKAFTLSLPDGHEIKLDVDAISGIGDSGDFESDLTDLMVHLGGAAQEENKSVCILIDETQYVLEKDYAAFIAANHRISQKQLPIVFICAGLPQIAALSGEAKSYAERLFSFLSVGSLENSEAAKALIEPAKSRGINYEQSAINEIVKFTEGYPYFIQEIGKHVWNISEKNPITLENVRQAKKETLNSLDASFFKVRFDRATGREKKFMYAMAEIGKGPHPISEVAKRMGIEARSASPTRATLIKKGFVYTPQHGYIGFTVPLFDEFLKRTQQ